MLIPSAVLSRRRTAGLLHHELLILSSSAEKKSPAEMLQINIHQHICFVLALLPKMLKIQTGWMGSRGKGGKRAAVWATPG